MPLITEARFKAILMRAQSLPDIYIIPPGLSSAPIISSITAVLRKNIETISPLETAYNSDVLSASLSLKLNSNVARMPVTPNSIGEHAVGSIV